VWRVLRDAARPAAENMAVDHALAFTVSDAARGSNEPNDAAPAVLRLYSWARPTVSFGRNEPTRGVYDADQAARLGVDLVRRPTGGRAVLHDAELTYAVAVPLRALGGARATYHRVNEALVSAVQALGADAQRSAAAKDGVPPLDAGPCFQSPAEGEVVTGGRKLVGSAQARIEGALLQHGSIIVSGDQTLLTTLGSVAEHEQPATLVEQIGPVQLDQLAEAVVVAMKKVFGGTWVAGEYSGDEKHMITELVQARYATDEWTWRR